jgi:hypothetical protein
MSEYLKAGLISAAVIGILSAGTAVAVKESPAIAAAFKPSPKKADHLLPMKEGCNDQLVLKVAKSIQDHPNEWEGDKYRMERDGGLFGDDIKIWIANDEYGLDFLTSKKYSTEGMKYPFTDACRSYLYSVTSNFRAIQQEAADRAAKEQVQKERQKIVDALKGL